MATKNNSHDDKRRLLQAAGTPTTKSETLAESYQRLNASNTMNLTEDRKFAIDAANVG